MRYTVVSWYLFGIFLNLQRSESRTEDEIAEKRLFEKALRSMGKSKK